jgi:hypothetical protein
MSDDDHFSIGIKPIVLLYSHLPREGQNCRAFS